MKEGIASQEPLAMTRRRQTDTMKLILTIAWRNILRHRGKSLVVGAILFLGALLMTVGNGVISGMAAGVEKNIVEGFMGDLVLISDKQKSDNILFEMMGAAIEPLSGYKAIKEVLLKQGRVDRFLPVGKNLAMVLKEDEGTPGSAYLLGVDFADYRRMFPDNFKVIEGRWPRPGERALLTPTHARQQFYDFSSLWLVPEDGEKPLEAWPKDVVDNLKNVTVSTSIVMMGMAGDTNATTDIRFPVLGVVKYGALNKIFGHFCLVDIESYRECLGYFTASNKAVEVPKEEKKLLAWTRTSSPVPKRIRERLSSRSCWTWAGPIWIPFSGRLLWWCPTRRAGAPRPRRRRPRRRWRPRRALKTASTTSFSSSSSPAFPTARR